MSGLGTAEVTHTQIDMLTFLLMTKNFGISGKSFSLLLIK